MPRFGTAHLAVQSPIAQLSQFLPVFVRDVGKHHLKMVGYGTINGRLVKTLFWNKERRKRIGRPQQVAQPLDVKGGSDTVGPYPIIVQALVDYLHLLCIKTRQWREKIILVENPLLKPKLMG